MSQLRKYRTDQSVSQRAFAAKVGVDQSIISRIEGGSMLPSLELAFRIERETQGAVLAASWIPAEEEDAA